MTVKQVAPLRQYQAAYAGGQAYVWKVMLGLMVGEGGLGLGVDREEQASATLESIRILPRVRSSGSDVHNTGIFVCFD